MPVKLETRQREATVSQQRSCWLSSHSFTNSNHTSLAVRSPCAQTIDVSPGFPFSRIQKDKWPDSWRSYNDIISILCIREDVITRMPTPYQGYPASSMDGRVDHHAVESWRSQVDYSEGNCRPCTCQHLKWPLYWFVLHAAENGQKPDSGHLTGCSREDKKLVQI